jgi:acyl-CoA synthetase (AMP-forming)/AMP-acid ligase II
MQNVAHGDDIRFGKFVLEEVARDRLDALRKSSRIGVLLSERGDRVVDGFPLTISGKVRKYLIREQRRAELHLAEDAQA